MPRGAGPFLAAVVVNPAGTAAVLAPDVRTPGPLISGLLAKGVAVLAPDVFLTGERANAAEAMARQASLDYFSTYNRTDAQERVQDLVTSCALLRSRRDITNVAIVGQGRAGLWALLAAPSADAVVADCSHVDLTRDDDLLADDLYVPLLRRLGDFRTTITLAAPHPLLLHNTGPRFTASRWVEDVYGSVGAGKSLRVETESLDDASLIHWLTAKLK